VTENFGVKTLGPTFSLISDVTVLPISRSIRRTFLLEKCDLYSTWVLCANVNYYFQTYEYPYPHRVKINMKVIWVAVTTILWVSMKN